MHRRRYGFFDWVRDYGFWWTVEETLWGWWYNFGLLFGGRWVSRAELRYNNEARLRYLVRLYFCPQADVRDKKSWMRCVYELCHGYWGHVRSLRLSSKVIFHEIWEGNHEDYTLDDLKDTEVLGRISFWVDNAFRELVESGFSYGLPESLKREWLEDFYNTCREYHKWLTEQMGVYSGSVCESKCYQKLSDLLDNCLYWGEYRDGLLVSDAGYQAKDLVGDSYWCRQGCRVFEQGVDA